MPIDVASLPGRSLADLRRFVDAQRIQVQRHPDAVAQAEADDGPYWRYLVRRASLEGVCADYQTYDAWGDENDWNLNIVPDAAHAWLLDPAVLYALSLTSGAPSPIDLSEVKTRDGERVIEAELTPDDSAYDKFLPDGLPISSGGWWPDKGEDEHPGPEGRKVGVYGVFCGDYGHDGRPEVHPFDAFWRQRHLNGQSARISWELGVFQDDSNRFNVSWSKAPIDVEFRIPFCIDLPVTSGRPISTSARFALRESDLCTEAGTNVQPAGGADYEETFVARTDRFNTAIENRVELTVRDQTGLAGRPFTISLDDVRYSQDGWLRWFRRHAWLSGWITVRVAVRQDGYAYWNLSGPNSQTASSAQSGNDIFVADDLQVMARSQASQRRRRPMEVKAVEPNLDAAERRGLSVEVTVAPRDEPDATQTVRLRPHETQLLVDPDTGTTTELESFDLFAAASIPRNGSHAPEISADIRESILHLAGLHALGRGLPKQDARIEVDDLILVDLESRYAPYRDGKVQGEERSLVADVLTKIDTGPVEYRCAISVLGTEGGSRRTRVATDESEARDHESMARLERGEAGSSRLVLGPFGTTPVVTRVEGIAEDRFGLQSPISALTANFRIVEPRRWIEDVTGLSTDGLRRQLHQMEIDARSAPSDARLSSVGMLRALVDVLGTLDEKPSASAAAVAGALRLADSVMPRINVLGPHGRRWSV